MKLFEQEAGEMGYHPFPSLPEMCHRHTPTRSAYYRPLHLLRLLRMVRLWNYEGEPAGHISAGTLPLPELRGAHAVRGVEDQPGQSGKRATGVTYVDAKGTNWNSRPTSCCSAPSACITYA